MSTFAKTPILFSGVNQWDLLTTSNFALTGTTAGSPMDGITLTNGMVVVLSAQSTPSQIGVYNVAVTAGNYTLTLITGLGLNTGTTYNNGNPFMFQITQGSNNLGLWSYADYSSAPHFVQIQGNANLWTPNDASGAGLVFSVNEGHYVESGKMILASFAVTYPVTVDATAAKIGGLPFAAISTTSDMFPCAIGYTTLNTPVMSIINSGATTAGIFNPNTQANYTNTGMSTRQLRGAYLYIRN